MSREPIAIIGMSGRFPGDAATPDGLWQALDTGRDLVTEIPPERGWDLDGYYDPDPAAPGKMYTRHGAFIKGIDRFDADFFRLTPREAAAMDPQQRLVLEVAWEALENAGLAPDRLPRERTAVFIGILSNDYLSLQYQNPPARLDTYTVSGNLLSLASGRLSYLLDLHGLSLSVESACASSLLAVHLAARNLRHRECDLALAGGVNLILLPEGYVMLCRYRALSPDGRCKTFDASADGYGRGEACGVLVLKRLSDALADGDDVLAVIRGSAANHDGRSSGLTVPNGLAQQAVIRAALADAGVEPSEVGYVEAHGTGTAIGDPIEVRAIAAALGRGRNAGRPLVIGSLKSNMGHAEAAAGVAGLIKVVLCLRHGRIPPNLHLRRLNPSIDLDEIPALIPARPLSWSRGSGRRIAGISSFGFNGNNVHLIVEEAPEPAAVPAPPRRPLQVLALSARSDEALADLAAAYELHLRTHPELPVADVCHSANAGRAHFGSRLAVCAASAEGMREKLAGFRPGAGAPGTFHGRSRAAERPRIAFLFTGQGSAHLGMGRQLLEQERVFREALERCDEVLRRQGQPAVTPLLSPGDGSAAPPLEPARVQPALFALEYALAELWRSWRVEPRVVLGHSLGEYAAACVAGAIGLEDALRLTAVRGRLVQDLAPEGEMVAAFVPETAAAEAVAPFPDLAAIAAVNGPEEVVISGDPEALRHIVARLEQAGHRCLRLPGSRAFHSPLMEPVLAAFDGAVRSAAFATPGTAFVSSLTGGVADGGQLSAPRYWVRQLREPVRFLAALQTLVRVGVDVAVEIGPDSTLSAIGARSGLPIAWLPSLRRGGADGRQLLESLSSLYVRGVDVDWAAFGSDGPGRRCALPTYPFQRRRLWVEGAAPRGRRTVARGEAHPLLGTRLRSPLRQLQYENLFSVERLPFLADTGRLVHVGVYVEMLAAAIRDAFRSGSCDVRDLQIPEPLLLPPAEERAVQLVLTAGEAGRMPFEISSLDIAREAEGDWRLHALGGVAPSAVEGPPCAPPAAPEAGWEELSGERFHAALRERRGLDLGASVRWIETLRRRRGEAVCGLRAPAPGESGPWALGFHPGVLDACAQSFYACLPDDAGTSTYLLAGIERLSLHPAGGAPACCWTRLGPAGADTGAILGDFRLFDGGGRLLVRAEGVRLKRASGAVLTRLAAAAPAAGEARRLGADLARAVATAAGTEERTRLVEAYLRERIAPVMDLPPSEIDAAEPLNRLGIDSLMALQIRNEMEAGIGVNVGVVDLLGGISLAQLSERVAAALAAARPQILTAPAGIEHGRL